jgi:hypothetical protein
MKLLTGAAATFSDQLGATRTRWAKVKKTPSFEFKDE